jgi:hypothetical protein
MRPHRAALTVAVALGLAACGTDDDGSDPAAAATVEAETPATDTPTSATSEAPTADVVEFPDIDRSGFVPWRLAAIGGVDFAVPPGSSVHHAGDMVLVRDRWEVDEGRYLPAVVIALISQRPGSPGPVTTVNDLVTFGINDFGTAEATGRAVEVDDVTLEGWSFTAADGLDIGPHYLFASMPRPIETPSAWQPFPLATLYMADTPAGALAVGYVAADEDGLADARELFEQIAPTVQLDGDRDPVTVVQATHPTPTGFATAAEVPPGWPAELEGANQPIEAGTYSTGNLGTPLSFTVDDGWWVQPNGPGWVTLSGNDSFGPGDRGLTFRLGLDVIVPLSDSFSPVGPAVELTPGSEWPVSELPTLDVSDAQDIDVGGRSARMFDVTVDPDADCSNAEPCEYWLLPSSPLPGEAIRKGFVKRVIEITDGVGAPIMIMATATDEAWFDETAPVIDSIRFDAP